MINEYDSILQMGWIKQFIVWRRKIVLKNYFEKVTLLFGYIKLKLPDAYNQKFDLNISFPSDFQQISIDED